MGLQKIVVLCIAVVVIGGGIWFVTQDRGVSPAANTSDNGSEVASNEDNREELDQMTFEDMETFRTLMMNGDTMQCDFESEFEGDRTTGVMYLDGGRYRINASVTADGMMSDSSIIYTPETTYTWSKTPEGMFAFMMESTPLDDADSPFVTNSNPYETEEYNEEANVNMRYDCGRWNADASVFVPPSDINFVNMAEMMQNMMNTEGMGGMDPEAMRGMMEQFGGGAQ